MTNQFLKSALKNTELFPDEIQQELFIFFKDFTRILFKTEENQHVLDPWMF